MREYEAIGIVEAKHFTTALQVVDAMCKASNVTLLSSEKKLGGRLVTTIVGGSIGNVKAAVEAAKLVCQGREELLKMALVITRPHQEIMKFIIDKEEPNKAIETNEAADKTEENREIEENKIPEKKKRVRKNIKTDNQNNLKEEK